VSGHSAFYLYGWGSHHGSPIDRHFQLNLILDILFVHPPAAPRPRPVETRPRRIKSLKTFSPETMRPRHPGAGLEVRLTEEEEEV
jgi:hypothetical protein